LIDMHMTYLNDLRRRSDLHAIVKINHELKVLRDQLRQLLKQQ